MMTYNLKADFVDDQSEILQSMTKESLDSLAKKHLNLDDMIMVVVGDKASVYDDLEKLGYPIVEINQDGSPK